MINISFVGDVIAANCECHKGQFVGRAFLVESGKKKLIGHTFFENEVLAGQHLDGFVFSVADEHLKTIGLSVETAKSITVERGNQADMAAKRAMNNSNPHLH